MSEISMLVSQIDLNYPSMLVFEYKAGIWKKPVSEFDYIVYTWKTWWCFILDSLAVWYENYQSKILTFMYILSLELSGCWFRNILVYNRFVALVGPFSRTYTSQYVLIILHYTFLSLIALTLLPLHMCMYRPARSWRKWKKLYNNKDIHGT